MSASVVFDWAVKVSKDGRSWQIGTIREVLWIGNGTTGNLSITQAIPPVFEAYATFYSIGAGAGRDRTSDDRDDGASTEANPGMPECYRDT